MVLQFIKENVRVYETQQAAKVAIATTSDGIDKDIKLS
jgi:hypothetical protein